MSKPPEIIELHRLIEQRIVRLNPEFTVRSLLQCHGLGFTVHIDQYRCIMFEIKGPRRASDEHGVWYFEVDCMTYPKPGEGRAGWHRHGIKLGLAEPDCMERLRASLAVWNTAF